MAAAIEEPQTATGEISEAEENVLQQLDETLLQEEFDAEKNNDDNDDDLDEAQNWWKRETISIYLDDEYVKLKVDEKPK